VVRSVSWSACTRQRSPLRRPSPVARRPSPVACRSTPLYVSGRSKDKQSWVGRRILTMENCGVRPQLNPLGSGGTRGRHSVFAGLLLFRATFSIFPGQVPAPNSVARYRVHFCDTTLALWTREPKDIAPLPHVFFKIPGF